MEPEEKKFLDLDMVAEHILHAGDRDMFREAVKCYHVGSHRAAVILVWITSADCLKRRLEQLHNEGDHLAQLAITELKIVEGMAVYEENLIAQGRKCELFDDFEEKCLRFARDTRSKCAHPSGVVPSAEAVRHILQLCSHIVLCRTGYRGVSFIRDIVTTQFDDPFFLPYDHHAKDHCERIIQGVPERLWSQFTAIASQERPKAEPANWRKNALGFFKVLMDAAKDSGTATDIANGVLGFEAQAPDFFAALVGLDDRVSTLWQKQKRDQARARLVEVARMKIDPGSVRSWATICTHDGLGEKDKELLQDRIAYLARHLPQSFLDRRRAELLSLLADMTERDVTTERAAIALKHLFRTDLGNTTNADSERILRQAIQRFVRSEMHRQLLEDVRSWKDALLVQLLTLSESLLLECDEDNADDILIVFEAASELAGRNPVLFPDAFTDSSLRFLKGELQADWKKEGSVAGGTFLRHLRTFLDQYPLEFERLRAGASSLIPPYLAELRGEEVEEGVT
jgi:hypothetical protein